MIPQIRHVLYATDLSGHEFKALGYAVSLADAYDADLTIVHIYEQTSPNAELLTAAFLGYGSREEMQHKSREQITKEIKDRLNDYCRELGCRLPQCSFRLSDILMEAGSTPEILTRLIESETFDILVMGRHHYGRIEESLVGHRSNEVLRKSHIPLLLVPLAETP